MLIVCNSELHEIDWCQTLFSHRSGQRWPWAAWWVWRVYPAPDGGRGPAVLSWRRRGRWCSASARAPACSLESSPPSRAMGRWLPPPERGTVWRSAPGGCPINRQQLNAWQFDNRDQNNSGGWGVKRLWLSSHFYFGVVCWLDSPVCAQTTLPGPPGWRALCGSPSTWPEELAQDISNKQNEKVCWSVFSSFKKTSIWTCRM